MKRMFKSERHFALSEAFPSDLLSSGAMEPHEPPRRRSHAWAWAALTVLVAIAASVVITTSFL